MRNVGTLRRSSGRLALGMTAAGAVLLTLGLSTVNAQQKAAPPAKGAQPAAQQQGEAPSWVKLCEKAPFVGRDKDNKEIRAERAICLTHHERIHAATGRVLVSAAVREVEGSDRRMMMVMLPLGMSLQAGMQVGIYPKDMWEKIQKREQVDDTKLQPIKLTYTLCHSAGCTAEAEATPEVIKEIQGGGGLVVFAVNGDGAPVAFPVPLSGFGAALAGQPADNAEYAKQRRALMEQIHQNQAKVLEEFKKQNEDLRKMQGGAAHNTAPAAAGAAPAPAAAPKK